MKHAGAYRHCNLNVVRHDDIEKSIGSKLFPLSVIENTS